MFAFAFLLVLAAAISAENCTNRDVFKNVKVLKFSGDVETDGEITVTNVDQIRDAYQIEVTHQVLKKLCEGAVVDFPDLDKLILMDVGVSEIQPGAFKSLPVLRDLRIGYNEIKTIKNGVFNYLNVSVYYPKKNLF